MDAHKGSRTGSTVNCTAAWGVPTISMAHYNDCMRNSAPAASAGRALVRRRSGSARLFSTRSGSEGSNADGRVGRVCCFAPFEALLQDTVNVIVALHCWQKPMQST
jgi:hypothetical protein